ncbi:ferroptosis suppressor protein 1 [Falco naumanni]|uniref:ferroptosis suppressor protein 1 n=1 Tax=Falco peregrinus TaxID=8954 RepID=UPI0018868E2E|nr:ferroptosis suppressor protein 1 [Falco peregrinus]XP_027653029.2 ferroptosis suppressor protein 1 [Falco cherrug]XP_037255393.1 ferroptosis suppressor protein 1 [Falco rusticolus]XP_040461760.1 ferroptosis suppressor protein 1 [Falco naumanni]
MGSRLSVDGSVRVVVVGGGFGGTAAASLLKAWAIPFVLVDAGDAFHHNVAALRAAVQSGFAKKTFISYSVTFGESFRQGKVVGIDPGRQQVLLSDGEELHYSHLILATGSDGPFPGKFNKDIDMESAIQTYEDMVKEIEKSERILVVGGGAAGVEMAAEIKTEYPAKEVTLIHSKIALADVELLDSVRQEVKEILLRKGVRLLLSERVSDVENLTLNQFQKDMVVRTEKGTEVVADMVVLCTGIKINSSAYAAAFGDKMASNSALKVNKHLQLEGYENIYAIGDCADLKEPKMAYHAGLHANIAVTNIINSLTHKPLKTYEPGSLTFLLSMGRNDGVGQVNGFYVGRLLVTIAKSRDLFVSKSWKTMGQTMPS